MTLRLNGSSSGYTEIDAPAVAGSNTLVLPTGNGSASQVLSTNGSGVLSWATIDITPTTTQVLNATAGANTGEVGTYAFCRYSLASGGPSSIAVGGTVAGSSIIYTSAEAGGAVGDNGGSPAGTWQCCGYGVNTTNSNLVAHAAIWLRIS